MRILHLEDDPLDAELIEAGLKRAGVRCTIVRATTLEAFEAGLSLSPVDLIISDSKLPGFDTSLALALARQKCPHVPFVFLSGNASPTVKTEALASGAADYLLKDDLSQLPAVIERLCPADSWKEQPELPATGRMVMAHCKGFYCLAFRDTDGKWKDFFRNSELPEVLEWTEVEA